MENVADKALELLKALAEKMGKTIEQLYPYFVRQVYIEGWVGVLVGLLACGSFGVAGAILFRYCKRMKEAEPNRDWGAGMFFGGLAITLSGFALAMVLYGNIPAILNPEYEAIRRIVNLAKGK